MLPEFLYRRRYRPNLAAHAARRHSPLVDAEVCRPVRGRPIFAKGDVDRADDVPSGVEVPAGPYFVALNAPVATPGTPTPTAPPAGVGAPPYAFDLTAGANQVAVVWRHADGADTMTGTLALRAWVHTGLGWIRLADGAVTGLTPNTEWRIDVGSRRLALEITAADGPANVHLYVGPEL